MLARAGAARVIEQRELTGARLADAVLGLLRQPEHLAAMESRVRAFAVPDAAQRIAGLIESVSR
jgi:UDP-N-acetylglucosamine--N-acetylmuramyl-(pentapeptide) pyrophosphoryl-undecaprenol N-acetylglucosamine transferase